VTLVRSWLEALAVYRDRRVLAILALGFSSGLPLLLTGSTLYIWLRTEGVSLTAIGLFALVGIPYSLKFLWSPLIDGIRLPLFGRLGQRRGWAIAVQLLLMGAVLVLGSLTPSAGIALTAIVALAVVFLSASQDIVIDAYRVEILRPEQQGAGATMVQAGYRIGVLVAGAGALYITDAFGWHVAYLVMALLVTVGIATILANPEPAGRIEKAVAAEREPGRLGRWLREHVVAPFADFFERPGWLAIGILLFIFLYKLGDAMAGVMAGPLYKDLGFTLSEIASVSKIFGFFATLLGAFLGGLMVTRFGLFPSLLVCGIAQSATILLYALQAIAGHDISMLALTVAGENITGAMGSAALVAYLSGLCSVGYTATQYAVLSSLAAVGRTIFSFASGWLAEQLGWVSFFLVSTTLGVPGILLLLWLMYRERASKRVEAAAE
jgi:PAT family beta-lactamase induction signal transducer AmpG